MELIGLKKCSTCRAVEALLQERGDSYTYREINIQPPTEAELWSWFAASGLSQLKQLVNTSGQVYRRLGLKDEWEQMTPEAQYQLLATDGMLVKRPILLLDDGRVLVGAKVKQFLQ